MEQPGWLFLSANAKTSLLDRNIVIIVGKLLRGVLYKSEPRQQHGIDYMPPTLHLSICVAVLTFSPIVSIAISPGSQKTLS